MNICIISPNPNTRDGIAHYSEELASSFRANKHKVFLLTPKNGGQKYAYHWPFIYLSPLSIVESINRIKKSKIEVVHIQYAIAAYGIYGPELWILIMICKYFFNIKIICTFHEVSREIKMLKLFSIFNFFSISLITDKIIVHTSEAAKLLINNCNIPKNKVYKIDHFTYTPLKGTKKQTKKIKNIFTIVYFGYIHVDKGIEYFIDAINILSKDKMFSVNKIKCVIAGDVRPRAKLFKLFEIKDQQYKQKVFDLITQYKLEKYFSLTGFLSEIQIDQLLEEANLFILPYTNAEQSSVLHKFLPYLKPIIASDIGGLSETLRDAGILVKKRDSLAIAKEIKKLIKNKILYKKIITEYKNILKTISQDKIVIKTISVYNS